MAISRFKEFLKKFKKDREDHLSWNTEDIKDDRSKHLGWYHDDVEHHEEEPLKESEDFEVFEDFLDEKDYSFVSKGPGGLQNKKAYEVPKYWEKGKPSNLAKGDKPPRERKPYHSDDPGQQSFTFKGGKNPKVPGEHKGKFPKEFSPHLNIHHDVESIQKEFGAHHETLNPSHRRHMSDYKESSEGINGTLRQHKGKLKYSHLQSRVDSLDHVTSHAISQPMTLYRGVSESQSRFHHLPVGRTFTYHGYTGTSTDPDQALKFSNDSRSVFRIHAPKGTKGHYFDFNDDDYSHEREVVLHRGTRFKILNHSRSNEGHRIIDIGVVGQRKPPQDK